MRRKVELIHQIRAMESVSAIRTKFVDHTETGGHGLLTEMSVVEVSRSVVVLALTVNSRVITHNLYVSTCSCVSDSLS